MLYTYHYIVHDITVSGSLHVVNIAGGGRRQRMGALLSPTPAYTTGGNSTVPGPQAEGTPGGSGRECLAGEDVHPGWCVETDPRLEGNRWGLACLPEPSRLAAWKV